MPCFGVLIPAILPPLSIVNLDQVHVEFVRFRVLVDHCHTNPVSLPERSHAFNSISPLPSSPLSSLNLMTSPQLAKLIPITSRLLSVLQFARPAGTTLLPPGSHLSGASNVHLVATPSTCVLELPSSFTKQRMCYAWVTTWAGHTAFPVALSFRRGELLKL